MTPTPSLLICSYTLARSGPRVACCKPLPTTGKEHGLRGFKSLHLEMNLLGIWHIFSQSADRDTIYQSIFVL